MAFRGIRVAVRSFPFTKPSFVAQRTFSVSPWIAFPRTRPTAASLSKPIFWDPMEAGPNQEEPPEKTRFTDFIPKKKHIAYTENLFPKNPYHLKDTEKLAQLRTNDVKEVAFIGRHGVGKTALIHAVAGRKKMVRTFQGHKKDRKRTTLPTFFSVDDKLILVDTPGYSRSSWKDWGPECLAYFTKRKPNLARVFLLLESFEGLKTADRKMIKLLEKYQIEYQVVITKADYYTNIKFRSQKSIIEDDLYESTQICFPQVLPVALPKKKGIDEVRCAVIRACRIQPADI
ncbi:P-loop containing nucleoside triphosphate hydrolase protein [Basidiobolus meristosporus CBS 931.73]|uniref:p-loop containing nucleoside triphosphate hydrolase protein n=1 Tax=Basidiobolus meristosporus CBS 931.73 TaxID=1314790 RepID=A0A1Y1Y9J0_9FUNG|nr:P-loop containing nucleoside triphosphate hydrolase protein [Basidiobolus meristosporus CBS 931.73]|eukprot:ORX94406.1 P-loop containing nucleoside triphosphate hydrolase protein [Basidiobolus meristosporus CBS 931.73]